MTVIRVIRNDVVTVDVLVADAVDNDANNDIDDDADMNDGVVDDDNNGRDNVVKNVFHIYLLIHVRDEMHNFDLIHCEYDDDPDDVKSDVIDNNDDQVDDDYY